MTNNLTLNATTFLEATYGWVQNQLGSMIISPVSNRFNAGLGDLPLLFPDAGVIDSRYYEIKPLEASGTPYFQDGRDPAAADLRVGQPRRRTRRRTWASPGS